MKLLEEIAETEKMKAQYDAAEKELDERLEILGIAVESKSAALKEKNLNAFNQLEKTENESKALISQLQESCSEYQKRIIAEKVDDLLSAFDREAEKYNSSFEKKYSDYCKARTDLAKMFAELVNNQREILEIRERITALAQSIRGISVKEDDLLQRYTDEKEQRAGLSSMRSLSLLPLPVNDVEVKGYSVYPEAALFINSGDMPWSTVSGVNKVAIHRESCSEQYMKTGPYLDGLPRRYAYLV